jgi:nitroreductase
MKPEIENRIENVRWALSNRRTIKVLADEPFPADVDQGNVQELIEAAGCAPFHRMCDKSHQQRPGLPSILPWRFYLLDAGVCRKIRKVLLSQGDTGKLPKLLATADTMILATWLPNPAKAESETGLFDPTLENMEHIAAASAAIQNLLTAATARGIENYWSSGGAFRHPEMFDLLGIPRQEILLGSLFLYPQDTGSAEITTSKLRGQRGETEDWARWVQID